MFLLLVPPVIIPMLKRRERSSAIPVMTLAHSSGQQAAIYRLEKIMQNTNLWTGGDVWLMHDYLSINICTWTVITIDYSTWFNYTQWLKIVKISHLPTKNQHQKLQILVQKLDFWWKLVKSLICIFALKIKILALKLRKTTKIESYLCVECKAGMNFCVLQFHRRRGVKDNFTTCGDTFLRFQVFEEKKRRAGTSWFTLTVATAKSHVTFIVAAQDSSRNTIPTRVKITPIWQSKDTTPILPNWLLVFQKLGRPISLFFSFPLCPLKSRLYVENA